MTNRNMFLYNEDGNVYCNKLIEPPVRVAVVTESAPVQGEALLVAPTHTESF